MRRLMVLVAVVAVVLTAGCSSPEASAEADFLEAHGLEGMSAREIVEHLDQSPEPRPLAIGASVRVDELLLSDQDEELRLELDGDDFYLALAPFVNRTHDCFFHSLATCQGELVEEELQVTITDDAGAVLVDGVQTTYRNGFVSFWLPRDIEGTIAVTYDGYSGEMEFATGPDSPTCVTTLQLTA